jgi:hypothetical protein
MTFRRKFIRRLLRNASAAIGSIVPTALHLPGGVPVRLGLLEAVRMLAAIKCLGTPFSAGVRWRNSDAAASCLRDAFKNSKLYRAIQF